MVPNPFCPQPYHAPEWNEYREEVGDQEHGLGLDLEVPLKVPEPKERCCGTDRLGDPQVSQLQERKGDVIVLNDVHQGSWSS